MKGYDDSRARNAADTQAERMFEEFDAATSDRARREEDERARKIARLKAEVKAGEYQADIKDIARLLTSAMDPTL